MKKFSVLILSLAVSLVSCASLQQDIYISSEDNQYIYSSIEYFENSFIQIDAKNSLSQDVSADVKNLLFQLNDYMNTTKLAEPVLIARLTAIKGLLSEMNKNRSEASKCYSDAKSLQGGDRYVLLLGVRLEKTLEQKLSLAEDILYRDSQNPVILLEKAKILISNADYKNAVAVMDDAFVIFSKENLEVYNEVYGELRTYAWDLYAVSENSKNTDFGNINLNSELTLDAMVDLTLRNTKLLDNYKSKDNQQVKKMIEILAAEHYFDCAGDTYGMNKSSDDILFAQVMTRRYCARFFWNIFVKSNGDASMLTKYSERYKKSGRTKSPVLDITSENTDFDAILGVVENEIMELPDGKNFLPNEAVSAMDYLKWVKKIEN